MTLRPTTRPKRDRSAEFASYQPKPRATATGAGIVVEVADAPPTTRPAIKEARFESEAWRRAVASLSCVVCGRVGTQVAHRNEGKGMGLKTDDSLTAALCPEHHAAIDQGKAMPREQRRAELDRAIVLTVRALARAGRLVIRDD